MDEEVAKEWEHKVLQNTMDKELNELNRRLQQKEVFHFNEKNLPFSARFWFCLDLHKP